MTSNLEGFYKNVGQGNSLLFHYTSYETATRIIESNKLRFTPLRKSKDPVEAMNYFIKINIPNPDIEDISESINSKILSYVKICCFACEKPTDDISYLPGMMLSRMWCQYAENQSGVCLVFDKEKLCAVVESQIGSDYIIMDKINYLETPWGIKEKTSASITLEKSLDGSISVLPNQFPELLFHPILKDIIFSKMKDYRDENEFRIAIYHPKADTLDIDFNDSLKAVIFGCRVNEDQHLSLNHLKVSGVKLFHLGIVAQRSISKTNFHNSSHRPYYQLQRI